VRSRKPANLATDGGELAEDGGDLARSPAGPPAEGGLLSALPADRATDGGIPSTDPAIPAMLGGSPAELPARAPLLPLSPPSGTATMPLPLPVLLARSRLHLRFNQQQLAEFTRSSLRSVQRWETGVSSPSHPQVHLVADAVRPLDPQIAAALDAFAPRPPPPPAAVVAPLPPPTPPPPPVVAIAPHVLVDSVVCAAAEAIAVSPQAMRPAVLAAFTRAGEAGLTFEAVLGVLAPARTEEKGAKGKGAAKGG
jgi:hypothetical protein